jgi:signal transduction histidine kinase
MQGGCLPAKERVVNGSAQQHGDASTSERRSRDVEDGGFVSPVTDDLQALQIISRSLSGKLELPRVLATALEITSHLVGAEGASILLIDPATGGMQFYITEGPGTEALKSIPLPPGKGICGYVARTGEPLIVNDAQNDPRLYKPADDTSGIVTRNLLCVPVRSSERLWGVLELINKHDGLDFDAHDLRLAEIVGTETALSLENSHLHGEIVAKERMAAIGQTVSGLAHCIKNILNGIKSGSAVMDRALREQDLERVGKGWQMVSRNNQMLSTLVLDMLALARDSKPHPFPTDLNDLSDQVTRLMTDRAAEKEISLECVPAAGLDEVLVDPTHFYRCLLNLVSNAVDACETGGHVRVRLYRGDGRGRVTVSISDDGQGISKEDSRRLFTEFFTTKGGRGTGLGLPVTRKLVGEMGGRIMFHSVLGRGTRFVFAVPISDTTDT